MQSLSSVNVAIFLLLVCSSSCRAQLSPEGSRLAQSLGMLLGLPLDMEAPPANSSSAPPFLVDIYNCWSALSPAESRASCLPSSAAKQLLEDVDEVRSIKGIGE